MAVYWANLEKFLTFIFSWNAEEKNDEKNEEKALTKRELIVNVSIDPGTSVKILFSFREILDILDDGLELINKMLSTI